MSELSLHLVVFCEGFDGTLYSRAIGSFPALPQIGDEFVLSRGDARKNFVVQGRQFEQIGQDGVHGTYVSVRLLCDRPTGLVSEEAWHNLGFAPSDTDILV